MVLSLLIALLGASAGALASFVGTAAGAEACDLFLLGAAAGCLIVRPADAARVAAFPRRPALLLAVLGVAAVGAAAALPIEVAVLPIVAAGVVLGRAVQAATFHLGVQGVPRRPWIALLVFGATAAPAVVDAAGRVSATLAAALAGAAVLGFAVLAHGPTAAAFDHPAPRPEGALAGAPTLAGVVLVGAGFARVVDGPPPTLLWVGAGALLGVLTAPRARRAGVVLGAAALVTVAVLGFALDQAPDTPWLADAALRSAVAGVLLGAGVTGLPRLYATLPPASKVIAQLADRDRPIHDGAVRRVALFVAGLAVGRTQWFAETAPWHVFAALAAGGALLVWFDPRAGIARRAKVLAVAGAAAAAGLWLVRDVG